MTSRTTAARKLIYLFHENHFLWPIFLWKMMFFTFFLVRHSFSHKLNVSIFYKKCIRLEPCQEASWKDLVLDVVDAAKFFFCPMKDFGFGNDAQSCGKCMKHPVVCSMNFRLELKIARKIFKTWAVAWKKRTRWVTWSRMVTSDGHKIPISKLVDWKNSFRFLESWQLMEVFQTVLLEVVFVGGPSLAPQSSVKQPSTSKLRVFFFCLAPAFLSFLGRELLKLWFRHRKKNSSQICQWCACFVFSC